MDKNTLDAPLAYQLRPDLHAPTEFVNFVLDIHVQPLGVPLEVDYAGG